MSAANVARAGRRGNICVGNNVSATMCPRLSGPLELHLVPVVPVAICLTLLEFLVLQLLI